MTGFRKDLGSSGALPAPLALSAAHWLCFGFFLIFWALLAARFSGSGGQIGSDDWLVKALVAAASASALFSLARELPLQNVFLAAVIILALAAVIQMTGSWAALPLLSRLTSSVGHSPSISFAGMLPLVWLVAFLNSRGAARWLLQPWRKTPNYGFRVMALTVLLALVFMAGAERALNEGPAWFVDYQKAGGLWHGIPAAHFSALFLSLNAIHVLTLPALINKKPVEMRPGCVPLISWMLLIALLITGPLMRSMGK